MDKQQALISAAQNRGIDFEKSSSLTTISYQSGFNDCWEAHVARQSPTDAVEFYKWTLITRSKMLHEQPDSKVVAMSPEDLYKLFNPSGATPQKCHCTNADQYTNCEMKCGRWEAEHGESKPVAPQTAGRVWVSCIRSQPPKGYKGPLLYIEATPNVPAHSEWLNEFGPQVFTQEQVCEIALAMGRHFQDIPTLSEMHEFMNTNYPTK